MKPLSAATIALTLLVWAAPALAAPPNDNRANPQDLGSLPATVTGTTAASTREPDEPGCGSVTGTVWYSFSTPDAERVVTEVDAGGNLDGAIAVYQKQRSQLRQIACGLTDRKGRAAFTFRSDKKGTYLVQVEQRAGSDPGPFQLAVFSPEPAAAAPGVPLPVAGVRATVDALTDRDDAYATTMATGTTYRINLATYGNHCLDLALYPPGTSTFVDGSPISERSCGGYMTFTPGPGQGGRYSVHISVTGSGSSLLEGTHAYHLQVAAATPDDLAPGLPLPNHQTAAGSLDGHGVDVVDIYRFDVTQRSNTELRLDDGSRARFNLLLLTDAGRRIGCLCGQEGPGKLTEVLGKDRYLAILSVAGTSSGGYRVTQLTRQITTLGLTFGGKSNDTAQPGTGVAVAARVNPGKPASGGSVLVTVERFDPLSGWYFYRQLRLNVDATGVARGSFTPDRGRYRATARFPGTALASPSDSRTARLYVVSPIGARRSPAP